MAAARRVRRQLCRHHQILVSVDVVFFCRWLEWMHIRDSWFYIHYCSYILLDLYFDAQELRIIVCNLTRYFFYGNVGNVVFTGLPPLCRNPWRRYQTPPVWNLLTSFPIMQMAALALAADSAWRFRCDKCLTEILLKVREHLSYHNHKQLFNCFNWWKSMFVVNVEIE